MTRHELFKIRLRELGLYNKNSDYEGMIGKAVEQLSKTFEKQRHSGSSAQITIEAFNMLMKEYNDPNSKMWKTSLKQKDGKLIKATERKIK